MATAKKLPKKESSTMRLVDTQQSINAVIYARYSSDRQTEESIEAQLRACHEYAERKGYRIITEYKDEAVSGKGTKTKARKQYQKMQRDCDKGLFSIILVHKYDRIARSIAEHVALETKLKQKEIELIAVAQDFGTTNEAKIMRSLMWVLSEYYLDNLSDEVKKGHKENALKALHNGGVPPFGYDVVDQKYVINEIEAAYVKKIFQCAANREGYTQILEEMETSGIRGKRGGVIKYTQIYEMLRNEKYTGVYVYCQTTPKKRSEQRSKLNAIRIDGAMPAIIDKTLFEEVQNIMTSRKHVGNTKSNYLCSGLVYCEHCGAKMHAHSPTRKGYTYHYYICSGKCGAPVARMEDVDAAALKYLHSLLDPKNQKDIAKHLREYQSKTNITEDTFSQAVTQKVREKEKQYNTLMSNLSSSTLPAEVVEDIGQKMQDIKLEIDALENTPPPKDYTTDEITAWLQSLKNAPDNKAVHLLIDRIEVKNKTDISITSTLTSVLGKTGWGSRI